MAEPVKIKFREVNGGLDGAPLWITTFVDMTSLLVTFFILLFTFSSIREYDAFSYPRSVLEETGILSRSGERDMVAPNDDIMQAYDILRGGRSPHARPADKLPENLEEMGQKLAEEHVKVSVRHVSDGLRVCFPVRAGFAPGSVNVNEALRTALGEMGRTMQHYPHVLVIEGYTDDAFHPTPQWPTAEDLSLGRAQAAARVLLEESDLPDELVQVAGLGAARPRSGGAGSALERQAGRRVEVVIVAMETVRAKRLAARER